MLTTFQIIHIQGLLIDGGFLTTANGVWDKETQDAYDGYLLKYAELSRGEQTIGLQPTWLGGLPKRMKVAFVDKFSTDIAKAFVKSSNSKTVNIGGK